MRAVFRILLVSIFLIACQSRDNIPYNILSQSKMQAVLWDMIQADQFLNDYRLIKDSSLDRGTESVKLYRQIFTIHHISKEQFQQSLSFYRDHPVLFKVILDSMDARSDIAPTEVIRPQILTDTVRNFTDTIRLFKKKKRLPVR